MKRRRVQVAAAHQRVREQFIGDRHLIQYVDLFRRLLASEPAGG